MKGTILNFDNDTNKGLISGFDGNRYNFTKMDIPGSKTKIKDGMEVDFEATEKNAKDIIILKSDKEKSKALAIWTLVIGLLVFIGSIVMIEDDVIEDNEIYGVVFWNIINTILIVRIWMKGRSGKTMAGIGYGLGVLGLLMVSGSM